MVNREVEELCKLIRNKIGNDNIKSALEDLSTLTSLLQNKFIENEITQLFGKYRRLIKEIRDGLLTYEQQEVFLNRIRRTILNLISIIEEMDLTPEIILSLFQGSYHVFSELLEVNQQHFGSGDNIAGNKIIIQPDNISKQVNELIEILQLRAEQINQELSCYYKYVEVTKYLEQFNKLHEKHVGALRNNNLILAHEILINIHKLSEHLEMSEFALLHRKENKGTSYMLKLDANERGFLICGYIVGEIVRFSDRYPSFFSKFEDLEFDFFKQDLMNKVKYQKYQIGDIEKIYTHILKSI